MRYLQEEPLIWASNISINDSSSAVPVLAFFQTKQRSFFLSSSCSFLLCRWLRRSPLQNTLSHCACPLKWTHCVRKTCSPAARTRRGSLKIWAEATAPRSSREMWRVNDTAGVCREAPTRVHRVFAGEGGEVTIKGWAEHFLKVEIKHICFSSPCQHSKDPVWKFLERCASRGGTLGAITKRECGLRRGKKEETRRRRMSEWVKDSKWGSERNSLKL